MNNICETCTLISHIFSWVLMIGAGVIFLTTIVLCIKTLFWEV